MIPCTPPRTLPLPRSLAASAAVYERNPALWREWDRVLRRRPVAVRFVEVR